ncbi:hypothetical protein [Candidatus Magnetominusculus xianensis]|uniref:Uncharacterized protein n=1 Tax=Candidatus Magnetominusculus xianensis TaxID=1748249 RepID=A0ABR5SEY8_9BACT|nr:hypothetical protein [Candidatus Magnetominusculus xianensis]KWT83951.1 hypothetical protein ASN18_2123 [Candidatus Magnetominusculus xianensis]MBF0402904.1 hypothetical protein [Nitrospirota bacterium]
MWNKIKRDFERGVDRLQWFAAIVTERLTIELSFVKMLAKIEALEKEKEELYKSIGKNAYDLSFNRTTDLYNHHKVQQAIREISSIEHNIEELKKEAGEIISTEG